MNGKEKERWITLPNGVHCRIEDGTIFDGPKVLQGKGLHDLDGTNDVHILKDTSPKTSEYQKMLAANSGDHYRTAREFFKQSFRVKRSLRRLTERGVLFSSRVVHGVRSKGD